MMHELLPHHLAQLIEESGISREIVEARGYRSVAGDDSYSQLKTLGFNKAQCRLAPGLLVPVLGIDGQPVLYQFKPDTPRLSKDGKPIKYETPAKAAMRLDMGIAQQERLKDPNIPLWITEGIKKEMPCRRMRCAASACWASTISKAGIPTAASRSWPIGMMSH